MRYIPVVTLAFIILTACVPSPTATPPLNSPFPTLELPLDTPLPTDTALPAPTPTLVRPSTAFPTPSATTALPSPIPPTSQPVTRSSPSAIALPLPPLTPLVEIFVPDLGQPVSLNQAVPVSIFAAANVSLSRLELYDGDTLYQLTRAPSPAPRYMSAVVMWRTQKVGPHRLRAIAHDTAGNASAPADVVLNTIDDNRRPGVSFTAPIGATDLPVGAPLILQGVATDEGFVTRIDLYVDDVLYTYLAANPTQAQSPLPVAFMWVPDHAGPHRLFLRAHDNADQTADSGTLVVNALDTQPPALAVSFERDNIHVNDTLLVHALALSPNGIVRLELWADNTLVDTVNSALADGQSTLEADLIWLADSVGDHAFFVRTYDRAGLSAATTTARVVHVRSVSDRLPTATPLPPTVTPVAATVTPSPTPEAVAIAPPSISIDTSDNISAVTFPGALHLRVIAHDSVELGFVEAWAFYQGEITPLFLFGDNAKGSTDKTYNFDWTPPRAGVAYLFARVTDSLGRVAKSSEVMIYVASPAAPSPTPAFLNLATRWQANVPTDKLTLDLVQEGRALRGVLTDVPIEGQPAMAILVSGAVSHDRVTFGVDFQRTAPSPLTLNFDCLPSGDPLTLACNYENELGQRGSAIFTQLP